MKTTKLFLAACLCAAYAQIAAQNITYKVEEANVDKYRGYVMPDLAIHLGGGTGAAANVGVVSQYRLPVLPLTLRGNIRWELIGVGKSDIGNTGVLDVGVMFPIIPGRKKTGRVKITTSYNETTRYIEEQYFAVDGDTKKDLMVRGGAFQLISTKGLSTTGLSAGLAFRVLEHAKVRVNDKYSYESNFNWQIYVDAMIAPISNIEDYSNDYLEYGGKLGFLTTGDNWSWYGEVCLYPKAPAYLIFGFLFDLGWDLK